MSYAYPDRPHFTDDVSSERAHDDAEGGRTTWPLPRGAALSVLVWPEGDPEVDDPRAEA
jgi:hypothetical protein